MPVSCSRTESGVGVIKIALRSLSPEGQPTEEARRSSQLPSPELASGQPRPRRTATLPCIRKFLSPAISWPDNLGAPVLHTADCAVLFAPGPC